MSRKRMTKEECLQRASEDLWTLIVYFDVTRPRWRKEFKDSNGKFDPALVFNSFSTLETLSAKEYKNLSRREQGLFKHYSSLLNYTFGIPCELVNFALGVYRDESKRRIRIKLEEVLDKVVAAHGNIDIVGDGQLVSFYKDETGATKRELKFSFKRKFMIDRHNWALMLSSEKYNSIYHYTRKKFADKIMNWEKSIRKTSTQNEKPVEKQEPSIVEKFKAWVNNYASERFFRKELEAFNRLFPYQLGEVYKTLVSAAKQNDETILDNLFDRYGEDIVGLMKHALNVAKKSKGIKQ